jgi:hypothetical protein
METLEIALGYLRRGWSVIPLKPGKRNLSLRKKPNLLSWKPFQKNRATENQIRQWFTQPEEAGIAIVLGDVSGSLICRDFDKVESYHNWAAKHPALAAILPTVKTGRGWHVYCRSVVSIADLRARGELAAKGIYKLLDGEFRIDGGYVVLPPSLHPNGHRYEWTVEPTDEIPRVELGGLHFMQSWNDLEPDPPEALLVCGQSTRNQDSNPFHQQRVIVVGPPSSLVQGVPVLVTESTESTESDREDGELLREQRQPRTIQTTEAIRKEERKSSFPPLIENDAEKVIVFSPPLPANSEAGQFDPDIEKAIMETLPKEIHTREACLWDFGRNLKAIDRLADASAKDLRGILREWHRRALPFIGTKPFEESRATFDVLWPKIKFAKGLEPMAQLVIRALESPFPPETDEYESLEVKRLAAICRELQRSRTSAPFFLSARTAGAWLEINAMQAWRYLKILQDDNLLQAVETGSNKNNKATRFRYLGVL